MIICGLLITLAVVSAISNEHKSAYSRVADLVQKMNFSEKVQLMHGVNGVYTGNTIAIDRLGIPALKMQDGPQGFRTTDSTGGSGTSTAWPSVMTIGASWDEELLGRWGNAIAEEFSAKGANMLLGPGIGMARVPVAGRNFEYLCGEDPKLGYVLVQPIVRGIQDTGIIANAKHFVNNEIEDHRMLVSANVDERSRFELYYPPFQGAVDAGVLSVMCAYNRINDVYACQNEETLGHLRSMGFDGWVVSDWTATKSTDKSLKAGLDQEMPVGSFYNEVVLAKKLQSGDISIVDIDRSVTHILNAMEKIGLLDRQPTTGNPSSNVTSDAHNALARELAAKSSVLLKNENNILPLDVSSLGDCIAVFGDQETVSGGGSGHVDAPYVITPAQGIANALSTAGKSTSTKVVYGDGKDATATASLAKSCQVAVVVAAVSSSEGRDRDNLSLGKDQDDLISTVVAANKNTIVALNIPGAILMPWADDVPAIVVSWLPGQEAGNALADILFGIVNPSGRLTITMPNKENEVAFTKEEYPGSGMPPEAAYNEHLLIGYRWYDANGVVPKFPFGHGLSYTQFAYTNLRLKVAERSQNIRTAVDGSKGILRESLLGKDRRESVLHVSFVLQNNGTRDGAEVAQVYLGYPASVGEPPRQLKGFKKVNILAGQNVQLEIPLSKQDISIWNVDTHDWDIVPGDYVVYVGGSSRDIRLNGSFTVSA